MATPEQLGTAITTNTGYVRAVVNKVSGPLVSRLEPYLSHIDLQASQLVAAVTVAPADPTDPPPAVPVVGPPSPPPPPPYQASGRTFGTWAGEWMTAHFPQQMATGTAVDPKDVQTAALADGPTFWAAICGAGTVGNPIDHPLDGADWTEFTGVVGYEGDVTPSAPSGSGYYAIVKGAIVQFAASIPGNDTVAFGTANGIGF
jgi:hypothetical protein